MGCERPMTWLRKSMPRSGSGSGQIVAGDNETTLELDHLKGR